MADDSRLTFWQHLDILRGAIFKILAFWLVVSIVAFAFKREVFDFVLAPRESSFVMYRLLDYICSVGGLPPVEPFHVDLINTGLAQQFLIHMKTAMCVGVLFAAPFALYELFSFVSPGLYASERRYSSRMVAWGYVMFMVGVTMGYYIIFPLTFRFLGMYQVAADVTNMITLESYMSTLIMMCLCMGVVFELPVVAWLGAKLGLIDHRMMSRVRRHAIVVILIVAAIITPTSDIFTLLVVSLPIWLLYEASVRLVRHVNPVSQQR